MQQKQKLMVDFHEYPRILIQALNNCIKEPHAHLAVFVIQRDGQSRLDFIKNIEFKFVELLSCEFIRSPEDLVKQHVTYRYNSVKSKLALLQARLSDVNTALKVKNPSLLLQLQQQGSPSKKGRPKPVRM